MFPECRGAEILVMCSPRCYQLLLDWCNLLSWLNFCRLQDKIILGTVAASAVSSCLPACRSSSNRAPPGYCPGPSTPAPPQKVARIHLWGSAASPCGSSSGSGQILRGAWNKEIMEISCSKSLSNICLAAVWSDSG